MLLLSIILPVYNSENTIQRCIESILRQKLTNFECIIINDGSTNNSQSIIENYAQKDPRIILINQLNHGVSHSRNVGIQAATGQYIGFIDSDDYIEPDMFFQLTQNASKYNATVSICHYFREQNKKNTIPNILIKKEKILNKHEKYQMLFSESGCQGMSFTKVIRREYLLENNYLFDTKIKYLEDFIFFYNIFKHTDSIFFSDKPLYHYVVNQSSVTQQRGFSAAMKTAIIGLKELILQEQNFCLRAHLKAFLVKTAIIFLFNIHKVNKQLVNKRDTDYLKNIVVKYFFYFITDTYTSIGRKKSCFPALFPHLYNKIKHKNENIYAN